MKFKKNKPFTAQNTQEERLNERRQTFTVSISAIEREWLDQGKKELRQVKDSTALKQLAEIGAKVLFSNPVHGINDVIHNNIRKNKRIGISGYHD